MLYWTFSSDEIDRTEKEWENIRGMSDKLSFESGSAQVNKQVKKRWVNSGSAENSIDIDVSHRGDIPITKPIKTVQFKA